jgi:hypothetical protein
MLLIKIEDLDDGYFIFMLWHDAEEALSILRRDHPGNYALVGSADPSVIKKPFYLFSGLLPF